MPLPQAEEKKETDTFPALVATSPSNDFYGRSEGFQGNKDGSFSISIHSLEKHHVDSRFVAPKSEDNGNIDENHLPTSRVHKVPPHSPLATRKDDNEVDGKISYDKVQMTPHQPYYPYPGVASHAQPTFPYPTSHHASHPVWPYYPPYYPPPFHYPPTSHTSGAAMIASSPYYPPMPYAGVPHGGPLPPSSSDTDSHPTYVPGYPYYGSFPPRPQGQQPPMSPLMQQPLFNSPGPSPSNRYYAPGTTNRKGYPQSSYPQNDPTMYAPPFFPPQTEFVQSDPVGGKKKRNNRKGAKRVSEAFSTHGGELQEEQKATPPLDQQTDDILLEDHDTQEPESVDTVSPTPSRPGVHPLATYVKPRFPTNQEELLRRSRKNSQARVRADFRKSRVERIRAKPEEERTPEEMRCLLEYERGRSRKNNRSRSRAVENKDRVDAILKKAVNERSKIEILFLEQYLQRKQRKNEGDRLRRERLKILGLDSKKPPDSSSPRPTVSARGPLPPDLIARIASKDSKDTQYTDPSSPGGRSKENDPYSTYGHYPFPGYTPFHTYAPPPYWSDNPGYPHQPLPVVDDENRPAPYHNSIVSYTGGKGPSPNTSWTTPPRRSKRSGRKTIVTSERAIKEVTATSEKENHRNFPESDAKPAIG